MITDETLQTLEFDRIRQIAASLAASSLGAERMFALEPLNSAADAERTMTLTGELVALISAADFPIHGLTDIRDALRAASIEGASLAPEQLTQIAASIRTAEQVQSFLQSKRTLAPLLFDLIKTLGPPVKLAKQIEQAISPDGEVLDDASPKLRQLRSDVRRENKALESRMNAVMNKWAEQGVLQDTVVSYREGRLALPVKDEYKNRVQGVIVDSSASGATVFLEPVETLEISNRVRQLGLEERREIHRIMLLLTADVHTQLEVLLGMLELLAELDELYARARLALKWDCSQPQLNDKGVIRILRGRHPLLIERLKGKVVPLSLDVIPPLRAIVVSGPNAGGKTVLLKTVGVFSLMASAGLFVPAAPGTELPFFAAIHADIGDAQSIESDLSTFTAHLARLKTIVTESAKPKLVLVDEIGSSTDPALGAALAQAVLLELTQQQAVSLVTTHHGGLKAFAHETDGMENGSMAFDEQSLVPTYVYRPGVPGSSYALEIAGRVGFPLHILETARGFLGTGVLGLEELVSELSRKIEEYEKLRRQSDVKLHEYAALQNLYNEKTKELKKVQAEVKAKAVAEAEAMIERTGRDMEAAIKQLKQENASKHAIQAARERMISAREEVEKKREEVKKELTPLVPQRERLEVARIGDRAEIEGLEGVARIVGLQKNGEKVEVEIGGVRLWTERKKLFKPREMEKPKTHISTHVSFERPIVGIQLDLRGLYGDEAIPELDSYLASASDQGFKEVTVIHGKGTGALRVKVRDFLNTHPLVKSFRDGGQRGDDFGSTVVVIG